MKNSTIILLLWITLVSVMQACEPNGGLPGNGQGQPPISDTTEENTTDTTETTDTTIIMTNRILIQIGSKSFANGGTERKREIQLPAGKFAYQQRTTGTNRNGRLNVVWQ